MIPLIWRGAGFFIPLSFVLSALLLAIFGFTDNNVTNMIMFLIAALLCFIIGKLVWLYRHSNCEEITFINKKTQKEKTGFIIRRKDKKTGEEFITDVKDTFFGINFTVWSVIYVALGVAYFIFQRPI